MTEAHTLLAALDAATCDAERSALIAAAPLAVLDALRATLAYRTLIDGTAREMQEEATAQAAFTRSLQAAPDDAARLAIIRATAPAFVAEYQWVQRATSDRWMKRYLQMIHFGDPR